MTEVIPYLIIAAGFLVVLAALLWARSGHRPTVTELVRQWPLAVAFALGVLTDHFLALRVP